MRTIPEQVYLMIDEKLRLRGRLEKRAQKALEKARESAYNLQSPKITGDRVKGGKGSKDRTEEAALRILTAEAALETAKQWEKVFRRMDAIFPKDGSDEGIVIWYIYRKCMSQAAVCKKIGCDRQTVRVRKDRYIVRAALLAAQIGLLSEEEITGNERKG